jgi:hypothetical protein
VIDWRRPLIYLHRWLGIAGSLLFVVWFLSGIVLMYAGMPGLSDQERRSRLPPLDLSTARVSPEDAAYGALVWPRRLRIGMLGDRPAYRFFDGQSWTTVFADSGRPVDALTVEESLAVARAFLPGQASTLQYDTRLDDADQWTFDLRGLMPLHRIVVGDGEGTVLYVSDQTAEVVLDTNRRERRWGYAGAVLHWFYFTSFRRDTTRWAQAVIWTSIAGCVLSLTGLFWGLWRYSPSSRYRLRGRRSQSPYAGYMRWHHYAGLAFGGATFTWIFSGLLSMEPWNWHPGTSPSPSQREAVAGGPVPYEDLSLTTLRQALAALSAADVPRELDAFRFDGHPYLASDKALVPATEDGGTPFEMFDQTAMTAAAERAMPGVPVSDATWLTSYDAYYYDRGGRAPLPVLRVRYADPQRTWLYLNPRRGVVARREVRLTRLNRWLYHGLHSLDFPFLYWKRPLWDIVVIVLSAGGIAISVTTVVPALRRFRRHYQRLRRWSLPARRDGQGAIERQL